MKRITSLIVGIMILVCALRSYVLWRDSEPTPYQAIEMYIARISKNAPRRAEDINVVSAVPSDRGKTQTLLFQATEQPTEIHLAGYAVTQRTLFGWYVDRLQMTGQAPLPDDMMASAQLLEEGPVIFGQVFLADATRVEAIFDDPNHGEVIMSAEIPAGNFVLFGSPLDQLKELRILDSSGTILKRFNADELSNS